MTENMDESAKFANRLRDLIQALKIKDFEFAQHGEITKQTLSGYLSGKREPSRTTLANWVNVFKVNGTWLLTGEGEMFAGTPHQRGTDVPDAEISDKLTSEQRNMLTYKRLQTELGTPNERIADGIDAIIMGKCVNEKLKNYGKADENGMNAPTRKVQEDREEFGKGR